MYLLAGPEDLKENSNFARRKHKKLVILREQRETWSYREGGRAKRGEPVPEKVISLRKEKGRGKGLGFNLKPET